VVDTEAARTIGMRVWRVRDDRGKSLQVVADLAGMSLTTLWRIENGKRAIANQSEAIALANALDIPPSELIRLPVPAPANGPTDSRIEAVRRALRDVGHGRPGGQVLPMNVLRTRMVTTVEAHCRCDQAREVGAALPGLIRNLYTSIAAGRDVAELLELAVLLHVEATIGWLRVAGAPIDLREQAVLLARKSAEELDTPAALGLATWGGIHVMLADGATNLAQAELDALTVPTTSSELTQLAGMLGLCHSLVAAIDGRSADASSALYYAAELAEHTGEGNAYWMGFGPTNVGCWRMHAALEVGDHDRAVAVAEGLNPEVHPHRGSQALYWTDYGRALNRVRGRHLEAVTALRRAELISAHQVQRDPIAREVIAEMLPRTRRDSPAGQELRGMADRAGLLPPL